MNSEFLEARHGADNIRVITHELRIFKGQTWNRHTIDNRLRTQLSQARHGADIPDLELRVFQRPDTKQTYQI